MDSPVAPPLLVLDSWPVLEWMKKRGSADQFRQLIQRAAERRVALEMSRMNLGEVIYSLRKALPAEEHAQALKDVRSLPLYLHSVDDDLLDRAVDLKARYPISYADAFAAALAIRRSAPLVTGDPEFRRLESDGLLQLHWVGA